MDLDTYNRLNWNVAQKLNDILQEKGIKLDPLGHEAWMPKETTYWNLYDGLMVRGDIADVIFVMLSKAKTAPHKNRNLLIEYLASPELDERFFDFANQYHINLEQFV